MPYAKNSDVNIYYEVIGEGPPLVLAHALTGSLKSWVRDGYTDALKNDFRLILFDERNRGKTDKLHEVSSLGSSIIADDVLVILDELNIEKAHYFGYSMGARVGFWLATHHEERFYSFILGGMTPYYIPEAASNTFTQRIEGLKLQITDPDAFLLRQERRLGRPLEEDEKKSFLDTDAGNTILLLTSFLENCPSLTDSELSGISTPCLVFCGELDEGPFHPGAKESANHIPGADFISFPNIGHYQLGASSDLVLPHVKEFLARVNK